MFKTILNFILSYFVFFSNLETLPSEGSGVKSFFDLEANQLRTGKSIKFNQFSDKKAFIIVNVACQCGFTKDHYTGLMNIYRKYKKNGLQILAFPCNQFADQQDGKSEQISEFVVDHFQVSFPIFEKIDVNGPNAHPVYVHLRRNSELYDRNAQKAKQIPWNFSKFILNGKGQVVSFYSPSTDMDIIEDQIKKILFRNEDL